METALEAVARHINNNHSKKTYILDKTDGIYLYKIRFKSVQKFS